MKEDLLYSFMEGMKHDTLWRLQECEEITMERRDVIYESNGKQYSVVQA